MIAVLQTGGKQYQVQKGDRITIEKLDVPEGKKIEFSQVLLIADDKNISIGKPYLAKAKVLGTLVKEFKGPKLIIFKHRPRENWRRKTGHRQHLSDVLIEEIVQGS
jgi:large subunit ribosomal protein L21